MCADTVVVTAPDSALAVLQPTLSDAIAAAQLYGSQTKTANDAAIAAAAICNSAEAVALAAAASAQASASAAAASAGGTGIITSVAGLPAGSEGLRAFATNGLKIGETTGSGTGVPVYYSAGSWRVVSTDAPVGS
jgi:hypothetical protein